MDDTRTLIDIRKMTKEYHMGDVVVRALNGIDLQVNEGEFVAVMGASGSGKSTLMNIVGCLDKPTSGEYLLEGIDIKKLSRNQTATVRNKKIGFVFQGFNLLARTSALENVELPLLYVRDNNVKNLHDNVLEAIRRVGLEDRMHHEPSQLSGGQQQRVAIARALVNKPAILLADEPTGNLDSKTSIEILSLFQELNNQGITIILVTHESDIAQYARRIVKMHDGQIVSDEPVPDRADAIEDLTNGKTLQKNKGVA